MREAEIEAMNENGEVVQKVKIFKKTLNQNLDQIFEKT